MTGTLPMRSLAPLEYRLALDAALPALGLRPVLLRCAAPALLEEARQRIAFVADEGASAGLWIEPQQVGWQQDLALFAQLPQDAPLVVVASRPMARLLPERRDWPSDALTMVPGGLSRLCAELQAAGYASLTGYGFHTASSVAIGALSGLALRVGRPDLADRLTAAARLSYCSAGTWAPLATVALVIARRSAA